MHTHHTTHRSADVLRSCKRMQHRKSTQNSTREPCELQPPRACLPVHASDTANRSTHLAVACACATEPCNLIEAPRRAAKRPDVASRAAAVRVAKVAMMEVVAAESLRCSQKCLRGQTFEDPVRDAAQGIVGKSACVGVRACQRVSRTPFESSGNEGCS